MYNEDLNQTSYTIHLASADKRRSTVDNLALKVSNSALSPEVIPLILQSDPADPPSELDLPQQHSSLQRSCDAAGLQSSLRWTDIELDNGQATLLVGALRVLRVCVCVQWFLAVVHVSAVVLYACIWTGHACFFLESVH